MKRVALLVVGIGISFSCGAEVVPVENTPEITLSSKSPELDTPAARALRKIPLDTRSAAALPLSKADAAKLKPHLTLDEIRIYDIREPEDFTRAKKAPMLVFRAKLDGQRPETPAETTRRYLCFIGLCGGIPPEVGFDERLEQRTRQSTLDMQSTRGTLQ